MVSIFVGGLIGLAIPLWITFVVLYRVGAFPSGEPINYGTAAVAECHPGWTTLQHCKATVTWSDGGTTEETVLAHNELTGQVPVELYQMEMNKRHRDPLFVMPEGAPHGNPNVHLIFTVGTLISLVCMVIGMIVAGKIRAR